MNHPRHSIDDLIKKTEEISSKQQQLQAELNALRQEISELQSEPDPATQYETVEQVSEQPAEKVELPLQAKPVYTPIPPFSKKPMFDFNLEEFIGGNLINKIGIAILVIGVGIGAKFAIENDLISPLMRIILGYLIGIGLLGFAYYLQAKYKNFSAVLLSGSMSIFYFITFLAYSLYGIFPQSVTFVLMVFFTLFTVLAALKFQMEIIALFGLVGAYAVPFLLSDGSGKVAILFSYMAIINCGILVISFNQYWKKLYYFSFLVTWLIYGSWYGFEFSDSGLNFTAFLFAAIYFLIFYVAFLAYKLRKNEPFEYLNISLLLSNSFLFYGFGYDLIAKSGYQEVLGLFTLLNGSLHALVGYILYKRGSVDRNIVYLVIGLVLVFITLSVPVQLDGNWVTIIWSAEAVLVFWIGRTKGVAIYEKLSYPLILLSFISLLHDWSEFYESYDLEKTGTNLQPIFNSGFMTSFFVVLFYAAVNILKSKYDQLSPVFKNRDLNRLSTFIFPILLILTLYGSIFVEIDHYWQQLYFSSAVTVQDTTAEGSDYVLYDQDLLNFKTIWLINYTIIFMMIISFINQVRIKNKALGFVTLFISIFTFFIYFTSSELAFGNLQESYLNHLNSDYYLRSSWHFLIRYLSGIIFLTALLIQYRYQKTEFISAKYLSAWGVVFSLFILTLVSFEWIFSLQLLGFENPDEWGLSVLWGLFGLIVIVIGILKKKSYLRILAISLFGLTLLKLFLFDLNRLDTLSKTLVFVLLGIVLLVVSFLYNKFKSVILGTEEKPTEL